MQFGKEKHPVHKGFKPVPHEAHDIELATIPRKEEPPLTR